MLAFVTTWVFWIVIVEVVFLFGFLAYDKGTFASVSLLLFAGALYWAGVDYVSYIQENPLHLVYGALIYFPVGTAWAVFKWFLFVLDSKEEYKRVKSEFLNKDVGDFRFKKEDTLREYAIRNSKYRYKSFPPEPRDHKYDILRWLGYWPFNVISTFLSDFVKRISRACYNLVSDMLKSISNRVFADMKDDFDA